VTVANAAAISAICVGVNVENTPMPPVLAAMAALILVTVAPALAELANAP
jgi:hypothetical protein